MLRIPSRFLGLVFLAAALGAGCLPGRGDETAPLPPTPPVEGAAVDSSASSQPSDMLDAEAYDDAALTEEEDRLMEEMDRAGSLHDADVGSLEDAFAEESEDDTRNID